MFLLIAGFLLLTSCETSKIFTSETHFIDFRPYAQKGFIMSTTTIGYAYESLGEISCICESGYDPTNLKIKTNESGRVYASVGSRTKVEICDITEVIDQLYNDAVALGANGIINLNVEYRRAGKEIDTSIIASGLAIKTKN